MSYVPGSLWPDINAPQWPRHHEHKTLSPPITFSLSGPTTPAQSLGQGWDDARLPAEGLWLPGLPCQVGSRRVTLALEGCGRQRLCQGLWGTPRGGRRCWRRGGRAVKNRLTTSQGDSEEDTVPFHGLFICLHKRLSQDVRAQPGAASLPGTHPGEQTEPLPARDWGRQETRTL